MPTCEPAYLLTGPPARHRAALTTPRCAAVALSRVKRGWADAFPRAAAPSAGGRVLGEHTSSDLGTAAGYVRGRRQASAACRPSIWRTSAVWLLFAGTAVRLRLIACAAGAATGMSVNRGYVRLLALDAAVDAVSADTARCGSGPVGIGGTGFGDS